MAARLPRLHRGIASLEHAGTTPVRGRSPALLLAADAVPRICRWTTETEPLDRVSCWDVPDSIPHGPPGALLGSSLIELGRPGGPLVLRLERPGRSALDHFDARTGAPIPEEVSDLVAHRSRRPSSWARDCESLEGPWDDVGTSLAFEADLSLAPPEVVLDQLGSGRQVACGRSDEARVTGLLLGGRVPGDVTLVDARCRGQQCAEVRVPLLSLGPPRAELLREEAIVRADAVALGGELVVAMAHGEAGVVVRRAAPPRLAEAPPSLLLDDLDAPTRAVRLITDGRGVVVLLDDGHRVRALRQRPDGSWVPQVATTE